MITESDAAFEKWLKEQRIFVRPDIDHPSVIALLKATWEAGRAYAEPQPADKASLLSDAGFLFYAPRDAYVNIPRRVYVKREWVALHDIDELRDKLPETGSVALFGAWRLISDYRISKATAQTIIAELEAFKPTAPVIKDDAEVAF